MYIQNNQISGIGRRTLRPSAKPHAFVFLCGGAESKHCDCRSIRCGVCLIKLVTAPADACVQDNLYGI